MKCAACGAEIPAAAKFCSNCGSALAAACPKCGRLNPRASRFCAGCGFPLAVPALESAFASPGAYTPPELAQKILSARATIEGERKQVTVLFADVAGFTPMAESLDPEEIQAIMRRCFDLMLQEVHRYEGTVSQLLGDGILALFGAPIAHEDHAHRAVRAALGIQFALKDYQKELKETRDIVFQMRVGLNSGPVVVSSIGADLTMNYIAVGDTVNLGARMQSLAEPGSVVISQNTFRLVSGYFVTRDLGEHQVKGKELPVRVYEVLRPSRWRSRVDVYAERGLSPFVGRQRDLDTLLDRFAVARKGSGQVIFIHGEPGIGKSRLLYEFKRRVEGETLAWLEGRCVPYGHDISYFPIIDLVKDRFEIEEKDLGEDIVRKLEAGVRALGADDVVASVPYLKYLLGLDPGDATVATMDPQMRKARIFEALRALVIAAASIRPQVVVVEDIHWIDPLSEEYLSYIAEAVPRHAILFILTYRSGYDHRFGSRPYFTHTDLQSLSEKETVEIAHGLLGADTTPMELQELISRKAEGNPFFVEEVTKSLLEVGAIRRSSSGYVLARRIEDIFVPDTIQGVIMARLDRLPEEPKRAIQTAAVIGREFAVRLLERTAELHGRIEEHLRDLKTVELIYERSLYPELAYMFKHALTHDVAYGSLLLARRTALHCLVGTAIEELYGARLLEHYEILAYHYERGEQWDRALEYLLKSGDKALAAFAPRQAVAFYDRALAVAEKSRLPLSVERTIGLHFGRGQALTLLNDWEKAAEGFQIMLKTGQGAGDPAHEGMALFQLAFVNLWSHRFEDALDFAARAHRLALDTNNRAVLGGSLLVTAFVRAVTSDLKNARTVAEEGLAHTRQADLPVPYGLTLQLLGFLDHWQGDHSGALGYWDEAVRIGRKHQLPIVLIWVLWSQGLGHCGRGEYEQALQNLREHLELSARIGDKIYRCRTLNTLGWVYMDLCNWDLAIQYNAQGAAESRAVGDPEIIRNAELNLGDCYLALGRLDEAQRYLETVQQESQRKGAWGEEWMKWRYTQHMNASLGELWLARGDPEKALAFADACLTAAEASGAKRNIVKGGRLKGEAFLAKGKLDEAEIELEGALRVAREVGNPAQIWKTLGALARLRRVQGRLHDAVAAYQEAIATVEKVASSLSDPALRDTCLASPQVSALREAAVALS